jgi:hypothetical protein
MPRRQPLSPLFVYPVKWVARQLNVGHAWSVGNHRTGKGSTPSA